jgi:hypothetical protein
MLKKDVLDAQMTVELPAREMMDNFSLILLGQQNNSAQLGILNIQIGQANAAAVTVVQVDS